MDPKYRLMLVQLMFLAPLLFHERQVTFSLRRLLALIGVIAVICATYREASFGVAQTLSYSLIWVVNAILLKPTDPRRAWFMVIMAMAMAALGIAVAWSGLR